MDHIIFIQGVFGRIPFIDPFHDRSFRRIAEGDKIERRQFIEFEQFIDLCFVECSDPAGAESKIGRSEKNVLNGGSGIGTSGSALSLILRADCDEGGR